MQGVPAMKTRFLPLAIAAALLPAAAFAERASPAPAPRVQPTPQARLVLADGRIVDADSPQARAAVDRAMAALEALEAMPGMDTLVLDAPQVRIALDDSLAGMDALDATAVLAVEETMASAATLD